MVTYGRRTGTYTGTERPGEGSRRVHRHEVSTEGRNDTFIFFYRTHYDPVTRVGTVQTVSTSRLEVRKTEG